MDENEMVELNNNLSTNGISLFKNMDIDEFEAYDEISCYHGQTEWDFNARLIRMNILDNYDNISSKQIVINYILNTNGQQHLIAYKLLRIINKRKRDMIKCFNCSTDRDRYNMNDEELFINIRNHFMRLNSYAGIFDRHVSQCLGYMGIFFDDGFTECFLDKIPIC